tara:strand:- start:15766 stop:19065 length:3300 start_codon:yes stop_codon:yes gene_type:complete
MKIFIYFTIFLSILGCQKDSENEIVLTGIEFQSIGTVNFGGVLLGETRNAAIKMINHGPDRLEDIKTKMQLSAPFSAVSFSGTCNDGFLVAEDSCIISIRFAPTLAGEFSQEINIDGFKTSTSGKGLLDGFMTLDITNINLGSIVAGDSFRQNIIISNEGDLIIDAPSFDLPSGVVLGLNTCESFISPKKSCEVALDIRILNSGIYNKSVKLNSGGNNTQIDISASVSPDDPDGVISFVSTPTSLAADGTTRSTIQTREIRDSYGNIVEDGSVVTVSGTNLKFPNGRTFSTVNGIVSFEVESTTSRGVSTVSVLSGQAAGFFSFLLTAGEPYGAFSLEFNYVNQIIANGVSQTVFRFHNIRDQFDNTVEDGTKIYFNLVGNGTLSSNEVLVSIGKAELILTAPTVKGSSTLEVRAGPIRDGNNTIIGWEASSDYNIEFLAGQAYGNINLVSDKESIRAINDIATITIGPVVDQFGNTKSNHSLNVSVDNGISLSGNTVTTNNSGIATLTLEGDNERGNINVSISSEGASGSIDIWAVKQTSINVGNNSYTKLFSRYNETLQKPLPSAPWKEETEGLSLLSFADGSTLGRLNQVGGPFVSEIELPYFLWDCMIQSNQTIYFSPCLKVTRQSIPPNDLMLESSPPMTYSFSNDLLFEDIPSHEYHEGHGGFVSEDVSLKMPSLFYIERSDTLGYIGGYNSLDDGFGSYFYSPSDIFSVWRNLGKTFLRMEDSNTERTLGDFPNPSLDRNFSNSNEYKVYSFGGFDNSFSPGYFQDSFLEYDSSNNTWNYLSFSEDSSLDEDEESSPSARHQNGIVYLEKYNKAYIAGGLGRDPENEQLKIFKDIWAADFEDSKWERICLDCGFSFSSYLNIDSFNASNNNLDFESLKNPIMIWHKDYQQVNILWPEDISSNFSLDPSTDSLSNISQDGLRSLAGARQIIYNDDLGRVYAYNRNTIGANDSTLSYWDMDTGYKRYFRIQYELGEGVRQYGENIRIKSKAYSKSYTEKDETTVNGVNIYIYNLITGNWDLLGSNTSGNETEADSDRIERNYSRNDGLENYVREDGRVEFLIEGRGNPGQDAGPPFSNGNYELRIDYFGIDGIF